MKNQIQYLLVGSGRLSRHLQNYFQLLQIPVLTWNRNQPKEILAALAEQATHVLLAISDQAIESFVLENETLFTGKKLVHFSGCLEISNTISAHPLMTFTNNLYQLSEYQKIPFILTCDLPFAEILPGLSNPHFKINSSEKPYYHALCVASGNFTSILWQKMNSGFKDLGLPAEAFAPYLNRICQNILQNPDGALTGPIARKDLKTVVANHNAFAEDPFQKIFRAFVDVHYPEALRELDL